MGCGSSNASVSVESSIKSPPNNSTKDSAKVIFSQSAPLPPTPKNNGKQKIESEDSKAKQAPIAFNISLDSNKELDSIFKAPLPRRLQHLAPLVSAPTLTAEELELKQQETEKRRLKLLETKNEKIKLADMKRSKTLLDIKLKQTVQQDRGKRARERRVQMQNENVTDDLGVEIEKFESAEKDDSDNDETWLPEKKIAATDESNEQAMSSGYSSREISASSTKLNMNADSQQTVADSNVKSNPIEEDVIFRREMVPSDDEEILFNSVKDVSFISSNKADLKKEDASSDSETLTDNDDNSTVNLVQSDNEKQLNKSPVRREINAAQDDDSINKNSFPVHEKEHDNKDLNSDAEVDSPNVQRTPSESEVQSDNDFF